MATVRYEKKPWYQKLGAVGEGGIVSVNVTPEMAVEALAANTANRNLMPRRVELLVAEIEGGRWVETGNTIKFSHDWELIDGQHRLQAICRTGKPLRLNVAVGLPRDAKWAEGEIQPRRIGQTIQMFGNYANSNVIAAVAKLCMVYFAGGNPFSHRGNRKSSTREILDWIEANPDVHHAATVANRSRKVLTCTIAAFCYLVFNRIHSEIANEWAVAMEHGSGLQSGDPWHTLRERLIADRSERKKELDEFTCAYCFLAWNARRENRSLRLLRYIPADDRTAFLRAK